MSNKIEIIDENEVRQDNLERRTLAAAMKFQRDLFIIPKDKYFLLTHDAYKGSFDQFENDYAYLDTIPLKSNVTFDEEFNMLVDGEVLAKVHYIDHITGEDVTIIDKPLALAIYSIVEMKLQKDLDRICPPGFSNSMSFRKDLPEYIREADERTLFEWYHKDLFNYTVVVHMRDFMRYLGYKDPSKDQIDSLKKRIWSFTRVVGVIRSDGHVRPGDGEYLMMDPGFDIGSNLFFIHSPYANKMVERLLRHRIPRMLSNQKPMLDSKGQQVYYPEVTTIVHPSIVSAKSKRAVEVVFELAYVIVKAGKKTPHITYIELIGRCFELSKILLPESENMQYSSKYINQVLRRTFKNVWEYIKLYTSIPKEYTYVEYIPKCVDYDYLFEFHHKPSDE